MKTQFWSDNAAPCWKCEGTVAEYTTDDCVSLVEVLCIGCKARNVFYPPNNAPLREPAQLSAAHWRVCS